MHGVAEDAGGYFCAHCGKVEHPHECEDMLSSFDVSWEVICETMHNTLEQEKEAGEQTCTYNKETRQRAFDNMRKWLNQRLRAERVRSYSRDRYRS